MARAYYYICMIMSFVFRATDGGNIYNQWHSSTVFDGCHLSSMHHRKVIEHFEKHVINLLLDYFICYI